ncbi:SPOR domain-containing protein [Sphingomonas sp.]|uniref:SPOR domain-containing protein n=1 Tax=Sphingomonas sp. TaxID=28214 RepID=UPI00325FA363
MLHHHLAWRTSLAAAALLLAGPGHAQYIDGAAPPLPVAPLGAEGPADALARNVRILAQSPRDYKALVGAGRAALATGDAEAAVGFFGRAADVWPTAPAPKAGMGAALAAMGEAAQALPEFDKAQRAGAAVESFAADRGLARDLLGQQALAQADYRLGLDGPDAAEARRRLALSLAISGDRAGAQTVLAPLLMRPDTATSRTRAFVLALGGDPDGADRALDAAMPGLSSRLDPFFRRLSTLSPAQKAAAVHLGIFPGDGSATQVAGVTPTPSAAGPSAGPWGLPRIPPPAAPSYHLETQPVTGDRLAGIDALLRQPSQAPSASRPPAPPPATLAVAAPPPTQPTPRPFAIRRVWVQLASGTDEAALGAQFSRIVARKPELFTGIRPFVSQVDGKTKLLIGPFHNSDDSATFIEDLADAHIDGFTWTSPEGQPVRKLDTP